MSVTPTKRSARSFALAAFLFVFLASRMFVDASAAPNRHAPQDAAPHVIRFGANASNVADLWLPAGAGPFRVILMVHGGCWQKAVGDRSIMNETAAAFRQRGFAVWNIEYRGVDEPGGGYSGTFQDAALGADALRTSAPRYHLDLRHVIAYGHSAGGHLALWLAARKRLPHSSPLYSAQPLSVAVVLSVGGLADLRASANVAPQSCVARVLDRLTGTPTPSRPNVFADTSPAEMLPIGVRQISISGGSDTIAPAALGQAYTQRARRLGDRAEFVLLPNASHFDLITPSSDAFGSELRIVHDLPR